MPEPVKPEVTHYREFVRNTRGFRAICHECKTSWPCPVAAGRPGAAAWWYVSPQQPKVKPDAEG